MSKKEIETDSFVVKGPNGTFDVSDPNQKAQLEGFIKALSHNNGKLAHELDKEKRSSSKRYDLVSGDVDLNEAKKKAAELRENGASEEVIDNFWIEFNKQAVKTASKGNQFDVFWTEYKHSRPGLFESMSALDQEVYKDYVKSKHLDRLQSEDDQFLFLDQLFEGKTRASKPDPEMEDDDVYFSPSKSKAASKPARKEEVPAKSQDTGPFSEAAVALINSAFGFDE